MIIKPRCAICSSKVGCSHTASTTKQWSDEVHLATGSILSLGEPLTDITNPAAILERIKSPSLNHDTDKKMNASDVNAIFIKCNLCQHDVLCSFLTKHIGMHIENKHLDEVGVRVADPLVRIAGSNFPQLPKEVLTEVRLEDVKNFLNAIPMSKIKDLDSFSFRKIKEVSAFSGTSKEGRYSDFTLLVWFADTTSTYNAGFSGGHSSHYGKLSSERLQIHLTYDSLERYFTMSGRVYKRNSYTDHETEDAAIPDRICEQDELMVEMRRIFLFFKVSPKAAYKRFLKTFRKGYTIVELENAPAQACTVNHLQILDDLKKGKFVSNVQDVDDYHGYGC